MKKTGIVVLALMMSIGLMACGGKETKQSEGAKSLPQHRKVRRQEQRKQRMPRKLKEAFWKLRTLCSPLKPMMARSML